MTASDARRKADDGCLPLPPTTPPPLLHPGNGLMSVLILNENVFSQISTSVNVSGSRPNEKRRISSSCESDLSPRDPPTHTHRKLLAKHKLSGGEIEEKQIRKIKVKVSSKLMYWMSFPIRASRQGSTNNISCSYFIPNPFRSFLSSRVYITHAAVDRIIQSKNKVLPNADGYMQEEEEALANKSRCDSQHQRCSIVYTSRAGDSNLLGLIPSDVPRRRRGWRKKQHKISLIPCVGLLLYRVLHCGLILYDSKVATNTPGLYF